MRHFTYFRALSTLALLLVSSRSTLLGAPFELPWQGPDKLTLLEPYFKGNVFGHLPGEKVTPSFLEGLKLSLAVDPPFECVLDGAIAQTSGKWLTWDHLKVGVSSLLENDVAGDPFSLLVSGSLNWVPAKTASNPFLLHESKWEWEVTVSIGKEWTDWDKWTHRASAFTTWGIGKGGSPWIKGGATFEKTWCQTHFLAFHLSIWQGFGSTTIEKTPFTSGWASYRFTTIQGAFTYSYVKDFGEIRLSIGQSLYNNHFFKNITHLTLSCVVPFNL